MRNNKLILILITLVFVLVLSACQTTATPTPVPDPDPPVVIEPPAPEPEPEPELPGAFFVMLDNHPNAQPQANLDKADIVYEYICEWTYTRFMAGYYWQDPGTVGPVRSSRYYFAETIKPYDTVYVHVGGNMDAFAYIKSSNIHNMCDITTAGGYFFRDSSRRAPHNCFVTTDNILKFAESKTYQLNPLPELAYGDLEEGRPITALELTYGTEKYPNSVKWVYQAEEDQFLRYLNGEVYLTAADDEIWADNIIIIEAATKTITVPVDGEESEINLIGSGNAYFVRNGMLYEGTWEKPSRNEHFSYALSDGSPWLYTEGNVWIQQIDSISEDFSIIEPIIEN